MFIQSWGCRAALILGSLLMATGYLASAFTTSLEALFFTYGVVVGKRADTLPWPCRGWRQHQVAAPSLFFFFFFSPQLCNDIAQFALFCLATVVQYMWNRHEIDPYNSDVILLFFLFLSLFIFCLDLAGSALMLFPLQSSLQATKKGWSFEVSSWQADSLRCWQLTHSGLPCTAPAGWAPALNHLHFLSQLFTATKLGGCRKL